MNILDKKYIEERKSSLALENHNFLKNKCLENNKTVIPAFEKLLEEVGSEGVFQKHLIWWFMVPFTFSLAFSAVHFILIVSTPNHNCFVPGREAFQNISIEEWRNMTIPWEKSNDGQTLMMSQCRMFNVTYRSEGDKTLSTNLYVNINSSIEIDCQNGWEYDHSVWKQSVPTSFNWVCKDRIIITKLLTVKMIGSAVGLFAFAILSDRYGRLPWYYLTLAMVVIFGPTMAVAPSFSMFSLLAFFFNLPFHSVYQMPYLVVMEICSEKLRSDNIFGTFLAWRVAVCLLPLITWLIADWKIITLVLNMQMVIYFFYWRILPESPRYLLSRDKISEFKKVMNQIARTNGKTLSSEFDKLIILAQEEEKKKLPFSKVLKSGVLFKHLIIVCALTMLGTMFYVGLEFNLHNMTGNTFVNFFILAVFEIPGSIMGSYCTDKFGRRLSSTVFGFISAACIIMIVPFITNKWVTVALCGISKSFIGGMFIGLYKQIGELFPTPLRATAYGITGIVGFASTVVVPTITALGAIDVRIPYYFLCGFCLLVALFSTFLPETLGLPYPQTIREALLIGKGQSYFSIYYKGKVRNLFINAFKL
ncbi:UNVERIFIED_CONTAM: hypothetical protein RMT77_000274 [Armadillidium vulgare]